MIANLKDITAKRKIGSVGLSVCEAPHSGVKFTSFEVSPTPVNEESFRQVNKDTSREFGIIRRPLKETIDGWKIATSLL